MKIFKKITVWMIISLIVQFAGLFYINNYFLSSQTEIKTKKIVKSEPKKADVVIKVPADANNISVSFDGRYLAYCESNVLKVVDTKDGNEKNIEFKDGVKVSFYKWQKDRNRILIAEKESSDDGSKFELSYYEAGKDIKENIKALDWTDEKAKIDDIEESPFTNVIYVKMENSGKRTNIYRIDIMNEMQKVATRSYMVGNMGILSLDDKLIYEDKVYSKIYVTGDDRSLMINGVENPVWIGVDENDKIYIADEKDNKISNIYCGTINDSGSNYQNINLGQSVSKDDVFVMPSGKIYINDNLKGIVTEVTSGKQYVYKGNFVQIYEGGIASINDGKLQKVTLN
ncbi:hypothetical protein [Clostridium ljungdahlii]|uniref:Uncharacterized protein n=1 Tax=Clostridium ljungdahlii TaxID=1538 RepID=A0A162LCZ7_9CLOT|nr:hypothetical protein [Clostridium ljungdahlii]OAA91926.1 hypothetical protein WY13_00328 [Clostridium ljungdahlii]